MTTAVLLPPGVHAAVARASWYQEYLRSDGWLRRRAVVIRLARWTCQECGWNVYARRGRWLEVHHLTYERLGDELVGDVRVLCNVCHAAAHGLPPEDGARRPAATHVGDLLWPAMLAIEARATRKR
jgi:hypothetical protein